MTPQTLKRGKEIQDEISDNQRILNYFAKSKVSDDKYIEELIGFFAKTPNLSSINRKNILARLSITTIVQYLEQELKALSEEFEKL